jgi:streptogramin lyase
MLFREDAGRRFGMKIPLLPIAIAAFLLSGCARGAAPALPASGGPAEPASARGAAQPKLSLFDLPAGAGSWPEFIVAGPQKAMWFTEFFGNYIGRVTMDGTITSFQLSGVDDAEGITVGGDGNIWFTDPGAGQIGRLTAQGALALFPLPRSLNTSPRGITLGPDGNVWFTEYYDGYVGRITPQGIITRFAIGDAQSFPWAIVTGPDGDLWFSESAVDLIGRFNPKTQAFDSPISIPTQDATPWGLLLAPDKHVWFTERTGDKIGEVTASTTVQEFAIAQPGSYPEALAPGARGELWFTQSQAGTLGHIDSNTGKFGAPVVLPSNSLPNGIAAGPHGRVWFVVDAYQQANQVGEFAVR